MLIHVVTSVKCHQFARMWFSRADSVELSRSAESVFYSKKCMYSSPTAIPSVWKWKIFKLYFFTCFFFFPYARGFCESSGESTCLVNRRSWIAIWWRSVCRLCHLKQLVLVWLKTVWRLYSWWDLSYSIVIWHGRLKAWCWLYRCLHFQKVAVIEIFKEETEQLHGMRKDLHEKTHSSQLMTEAP